MKQGIFLIAICVFGLNCGGAATNTANKPANAAANTNANKPAATPTPAATPASSNSSSEKSDTGSNAELDFDLVNKTGYDIKAVFVGPTSTKDWSDDMEVLHGKNFGDGATLALKFHPKATAEKWDVKVEWADGSGTVEWLDLNLTKIEKVTLKYDKGTDKTTAVIE